MKKKYVSRLLAGCLTVTMLTPTGALASVPQPVVTQEASQEAGQENETESKEQAAEYAAEGTAEVQTDETEAAENRTAADKSREQAEPQTAQTGEQAEPQTTQTGEQAVSEAEPQAQVQPRAVVAVNQWIRDGNRWWYRHADGSYTTNGWEVINGAWYYFDGAGWMVTGWVKLSGTWYYLTGSGAMAANTWIGSYYVNGSGAWVPGQTTGTITGGGSKNKIIAIDAGHQRKGNSAKEPIGPGASQTKPKVASGTHGNASGLNEYELTLQVSLKLRDELQARGYQVYMIRETHDVNISNAERAQMAANQGADILVRIHANGSDNTSVAGALTMAPSNSNPYLGKSVISASQTLSRKIVDCFCAATGAKNQGVMQTDTMSGINWSSIPVSIVEMGYMTNRTEDLNMASTSYQTKMVQGIANGIDAYYGA